MLSSCLGLNGTEANAQCCGQKFTRVRCAQAKIVKRKVKSISVAIFMCIAFALYRLPLSFALQAYRYFYQVYRMSVCLTAAFTFTKI